jgi:hypothetical protein
VPAVHVWPGVKMDVSVGFAAARKRQKAKGKRQKLFVFARLMIVRKID